MPSAAGRPPSRRFTRSPGTSSSCSGTGCCTVGRSLETAGADAQTALGRAGVRLRLHPVHSSANRRGVVAGVEHGPSATPPVPDQLPARVDSPGHRRRDRAVGPRDRASTEASSRGPIPSCRCSSYSARFTPGTRSARWRHKRYCGRAIPEAWPSRSPGSPMPSMHVALPMLFVLVAWKSGPLLRLLFLAYLGFNLVSSVLLGWHYAIDGYAAMLGVVMIWIAVGRLTRGVPAGSPSEQPPPPDTRHGQSAHVAVDSIVPAEVHGGHQNEQGVDREAARERRLPPGGQHVQQRQGDVHARHRGDADAVDTGLVVGPEPLLGPEISQRRAGVHRLQVLEQANVGIGLSGHLGVVARPGGGKDRGQPGAEENPGEDERQGETAAARPDRDSRPARPPRRPVPDATSGRRSRAGG